MCILDNTYTFTGNHYAMTPVPFTNLAISLSGGGYRATTFHLGALTLLDAVSVGNENLLERTKVLSTISGGTLTGVMYALKVAEDKDLQACFTALYDLLERDELVERALHKLNYPAKWKNQAKSRDVINAFAEVYNEYFYEEATFAKLYDGERGHLTDVVFGASEFTTGVQFRFQEDHDDGLFGNGNLFLPEEVARKVRLADAAASSSCFPGGFEPMIMPKDYGEGKNSAIDVAWREKGYPTTAIMDGGVLDNQGIEGVKLAEERHEKEDGEPFVGTYIVSDVSSREMAPYVVPELEHSSFKDLFTLRRINVVALTVLVAIVAYLFLGENHPEWVVIGTTAILTLISLWLVFFFVVRSVFRNAIKSTFSGADLPEILKDASVITKTPLYILVYLVEFRAGSVMKMVMDLFLRRIRALQITSLFASDEWNGRVKTNNIYTLQKKALKGELPKEMTAVVHAANNMPTTLWFNEEEKKDRMLDKLIACGQLSLCYNLIKYAKDIRKKEYDHQNIWDQLTEVQRAEIGTIEATLEEYWQRFLEDPYWLLNRLKEGPQA